MTLSTQPQAPTTLPPGTRPMCTTLTAEKMAELARNASVVRAPAPCLTAWAKRE